MADFSPPRKFTLDDFRKLLDPAKSSAPADQGTDMLPSALSEGMREAEQQEMDRLRGIIDAMTPEERRDPVSVIGESRARRIAAGAGVGCEEVGHLLRQFQAMADILDHLARRGPPD